MTASVTIIIPTLASTGRGPFVLRAVKSVLSLDVPSVVLVIVNGGRHDEAVVRAVADAGATIVRSDAVGVSAARLDGRRRVATPLFGFLDDDDHLLPQAGTQRSRHFADPAVDIVVSNGYTATPEGNTIPFCELPAEPADAARSILLANWLASAAAFYRTASVGAEPFENLPDVMEWTVLGFRLALRHKVRFTPELTYVIGQDAPDRSTKTRNFTQQAPRILDELRRENLRPDLAGLLARKVRAAHHTAADHALWEGDMPTAWRHHLASLKGAGLWRYGSVTRHLIRRQWQLIRDPSGRAASGA